jgi:hypothetical protein
MNTATDKTPVEKTGPRDVRDLEVSYGREVPQPHMKKGEFVAIGILAGSTDTAPSVSGERIGEHIHDSIVAAEKNL